MVVVFIFYYYYYFSIDYYYHYILVLIYLINLGLLCANRHSSDAKEGTLVYRTIISLFSHMKLFRHKDALSEVGWIFLSFSFLVLTTLSIASIAVSVRLESYVLVYWPFYSLWLSFFGFGLLYFNWKSVPKIEKIAVMGFLFQMYRHYEMHGVDWKLRDDYFRTDFCRSFFGHNSRWFCVYDEPLIFVMHCIAEFVLGMTALYYSNTRSKITIICHGYTLALTLFVFYLAVVELKYIAGLVASIICFFFNFYCTGQIIQKKRMRVNNVIKYFFVGFAMRILIFFLVALHPGQPRLNIHNNLVYIDGLYHKFLMLIQILISFAPLIYMQLYGESIII